MSKVNVPDEMMKAAHAVFIKDVSIAKGQISYSLRPVIEAAVQWLDTELEKMIEVDPYAKDMYGRSESLSGHDRRAGHNHAIGKVRSMFLIPEPNPLKVEVPKAGTYHIDEQGKATACIKGEESKGAGAWSSLQSSHDNKDPQWAVGSTWRSPNGTEYLVQDVKGYPNTMVTMKCTSDGIIGTLRWALMSDWTMIPPAPQKEKSVAEVDANIPDLLFDCPTHVTVNVANEQIRKAFRRGFNKGSKHEI